jgi:hypothetical protein
MSTVTVPRSNVTVEEVSAVLRKGMGSRYQITPVPGDKNGLFVKSSLHERTKVEILQGGDSTKIQIRPSSAFTLVGIFINFLGITRKVHQVLEHAPELARLN